MGTKRGKDLSVRSYRKRPEDINWLQEGFAGKSSRQEETATAPRCVCGPPPTAEGIATSLGWACGPEPGKGAVEAAVRDSGTSRRPVRIPEDTGTLSWLATSKASPKLGRLLQVGFDLTQLGLSLTPSPMKSRDTRVPRVPRVPLPIIIPGITPGIIPAELPRPR